jgi:hypothetical protein
MGAGFSVGRRWPLEKHERRLALGSTQRPAEQILSLPALEHLLLEIIRRLRRGNSPVSGGFLRSSHSRDPNRVVPRRTIVAPSSTAIS